MSDKREIKKFSGHREKVICGKVPIALYDAVKELVDTGEYDSVNTFVEEALNEKMAEVEINRIRAEIGRDANDE